MPIVVGVYLDGLVSIDTPLCIPDRKFMEIGRVAAIRVLESPDPTTQAGNTVAILKIEPMESKDGERQIILGRDFQMTDQLYAKISNINQLPPHLRNTTDPFVQGYKRIFGLKPNKNNY